MSCAARGLSVVLLVFLCFKTMHGQNTWVGSWASAQQLVEPQNSIPAAARNDITLRQIVHLSVGGSELRLRLSNRFGTAPLHFDAVHVAKAVAAGSAAIVAGSDKAITFSSQADVIVPAGADYVSDSVPFSVPALSDVAITMYLATVPAEQTGHPGSRTTSYLAHGNLVSAANLPNAAALEHWYFLSGIGVQASGASAIVALGDSITDGHGATPNGNNRWPDVLAQRLQSNPGTENVAVLNEGIGGNRVLLDQIGPNALARFDHDVLAPTGVRYLIVLEGINDIGMLNRADSPSPADHERLVRELTGAYQQIIWRAHMHGIRVYGATITPFVGSGFYRPGPASEADRQAGNEWIRAPGHFDAVIDFDKLTRDPQHPDRLLPTFDSGDHLHPSPAGYAAMANAIPLSLFTSSANNVEGHPQIAFTFDDLPAHGPLPPGETRVQLITRILAALKGVNVPPTYGFVNAQWLEKEPGDAAVLQAWRDAGYPLGNHSWSHMNLDQHTLAEFESDVERDEPVLAKFMDDQDWHWFRFPFLAEGDTPQKRAGVREFLGLRGYKVAGVTMSFGDYMWNEPYARCRAKRDTKAIALLESSYLQAADDSISYYRNMAHSLFGHDIPYVLLMHVGALDAEMLPRLLELYRSRGIEFVTLQQAESDPFYAEDTDPYRPPGPDMLEGLMAERHLPLPAHTTPAVPFDKICK